MAHRSVFDCSLVILALAGGCSSAKPVFPHPRYAPYGIGSEQLVVQDNSRGTPANGEGFPALPYRQLPLYIWYPALGDVDAGEVTGAKLDPRGAPYPLVVFVHGSSGFSQQSTFLTQALAADGYVVAAADFPLTALTTPGGSSDFGSNLQVGDASFIATQLAANSQDPKDPLYLAIDPDAGYAVEGHSTGGAVALDAAYSLGSHDSRVKAIVGLAPDACFFASKMFTTRKVPMMVIAGTDDHFNPPWVNGERAYGLATTSPRWLAMLTGGTHLYFTDFALPDGSPTPDMPGDPIVQAFSSDGGGGQCTVGPITTEADPLIDFDLQHTLTIQLSEAFLDQWMWQDDSTMKALTASHDPHLVLSSSAGL
jgi:predicted dienelactone hydrolase